MEPKNFNSIDVLKLTTVMNSVPAGSTLLLGSLPKSFTVIHGFIQTDADPSDTSKLSIGDIAEPARYLDNVNFGDAATSAILIAFSGLGFGIKSDGGVNAEVLAKNTGVSATTAEDVTVTVTLQGYYEHS